LCAVHALAVIASPALAQQSSPEIARGLQWLSAQVQAGGTLANESSSIATPLQSRAEAAQTLKLLLALPSSLVDAIGADTEDNTEYLARRAVSLTLAGRDASATVALLASRQNPDGGFGGGQDYDSNALDTAWALIALHSSASLGPVPQALGYLGLAQAFDGSYSAPGRPDIETTAITVIALGLYASQFDSFAAIARAVPYLLAQQSPGQQWGNSAFLTATVYGAIHDFVPLQPTATAVRSFLAAQQGADGSWDSGDPFSTALALRALVLSATPPANPTLGIVKGRVIDSQTKLGLDGVAVTLSGPSNPVPTATSSGSFEFRDLFPGTYTLQLTLNQYGVITFSTTLRPGQTLDFGAIAFTKNGQTTTGTVRGTVSDATTGLPLVGASVSLSSGESATTDATGSYQIANIAPANVIAVANKSGYASAPGSGAVVAGGTMIFSPSLFPVTQSTGAAIEGTVSDAVTHAPLQGATITVAGSTQASATTDSQGRYRIAPLTPGVITVSVERVGYRSATSKVTVAADTSLEYSPGLQQPGNGTAKLFVVSDQGEGSTNQVFRYELTGPSSSPVLAFTLAHASLDKPCCVAFSEAGDMVVVNRGAPTPGNGSLARFTDPGGTASFKDTITSTSFSGPIFATFKHDELFVAQRFGNNVLRFKFDGAGNVSANGAITAGLGATAPRGVAANPATGELFVTQCCGIDSINRYVFDADGNAVPNGVITGGGLNNPHDMAFSARGELFVANVNGNSISRFVFDAAGNAFPNGQIVGNGLNGPLGLDFSPWGELFVANFMGTGGVSRWLFDASFNAIPNGSFPTPVTLGDLQFLPSVPGVKGVVLDASSDQPLAGVTVQGIVGSTSRALTTGADGRFELDGLPAGQAQITFTLTGYLTQNFALELSTLTDIDIGPVRLRQSSVGTLLPDLVVRAVDTQPVVSDPRSFALSGSLNATIANQGTAPTTAGFRARAFYDANRNGVYDAGVDVVLGEGQSGGTLAVNATAQVSIPLAGALPFRDAPIQVWVDSDQSVVESNELNNVSAAACQVTPAPATVNIAPTNGIATADVFEDFFHRPQLAIDGDRISTMWNAGSFAPHWLMVNLQRPFKVSAIFLKDIIGTPGVGFYGFNNIYNLYIGADGITWTKIASGTLTESIDPLQNSAFIPIPDALSTFQFVKYEVVGGSHWSHLMDMEILTLQQASAVTASDLTASTLQLTDLGSGQLRLSARVGNGGATASPATTTSFYDGDPAQGGALIGSVPVATLQPGQFVDVNLLGALSISGSHDLFAVADPANLIAECRETNNTISAPPLPALTGSIVVATDAVTYNAQSPVRVSATVVNTSPLPVLFTVAIRVEDGNGVVVATFPPHVGVTLAAGANIVVSDTWNTGSTLAGAYQVKAELLDDTGQPYASATTPFGIGAGPGAVSAKVGVDKLSYLPSDTVQLTSRLANLSANQPLDNLTAVTTVSNPDGTARFTRSEPVAQLAQSTLRDFNYALPLGFASAGTYNVSLNLSDALGALLASNSTSFTVGSSAASGAGLTGSLSGTPKPIPYGDPIVFSATLNNLGNADLAALGATITIVDPVAQHVLAQFPATLALARGQSAPVSASWAANATVGTIYVAVLSATVGAATVTLAQDAFMVAPPVTRVTGTLAAIPKQVPQGDPVALNLAVINTGFGAISSLPLSVTVTDAATHQVVAQFTDSANIALAGTYQKEFSWPVTSAVGTNYTAMLTATVDGVARTLAQDSFTVIQPPVNLNVTLDRLKEARVLVLLSCEPDVDHDSNNHDHHVHGADGYNHDHGNGVGHDHGHHDGHYDSSDYDDRHYQDGPDDQRHGYDHGGPSAQACIAQRAAFLDGYLASLGVRHLITSTEADFRKALRSGAYNTYWIAGGGEKLEHDLDEELREAVFRGGAMILDRVHDERNHSLDAIVGVNVQGKDNPSGQTVNVTGAIFAAGSIVTAGRPLRVQLTTGQAQAVFPAEGNEPAIVSNQYGQGRALLFAFDLVGTLSAQPGSGALQGLTQAALGWLAPDLPATDDAGGYTVVRTRITNLGLAVDTRVTLTLPAGATLLTTSPAAALDANGRPVWTVTLDSGQTADLEASIRLPLAAGNYAVQAAVETTRNGQTTLYNTTNLSFAVTDAATVSGQVVAGLQGLTLASAEKQSRDRAVAHVQSAQTKLAAARYEDAIDELLEAVEDLMKITSVDTSAQRLQIDRMLDEAGYRWYLALP
jgi:hypothetical protein